MINLGIVGLGNIFDWQYKALCDFRESITITSVFDIDTSKAHSKIRDLNSNAVVFDQYSALLNDPGTDTLLISTPPHTHSELAEAAVNSKKNVIIEKPVCDNYESFIKLLSLDRQPGTSLYSAFHAAFAEDLIWFIENMDNLKEQYSLGRMTDIVCSFSDPYTGGNNIIPGKGVLGGSYLDSGVNALSVCEKLTDLSKYRMKSMNADKNADGTIISSTTIFEANDPELPVFEINTNWDLGINRKITVIHYENGNTVLLDHSKQSVLISTDSGSRTIALDSSCNDMDLLYANTSRERLHAQYHRLFEDYLNARYTGRDNTSSSMEIHRLLFGQ